VAAGQKLPLSLELEEIVVVEEKPLPIPGLIVAGAGVLCLVGSMALAANAQYNRDQLTNLYRAGGTWDERYAGIDSTRVSSGVFSGIFGVLGGAAVAGGATLIVLNYFLKPPPRAKAKAPAAESDEAPAQEEKEEEAPAKEQPADPESSLMLVPIPGGAYATFSVTF
jgi:hypothetical protein